MQTGHLRRRRALLGAVAASGLAVATLAGCSSGATTARVTVTVTATPAGQPAGQGFVASPAAGEPSSDDGGASPTDATAAQQATVDPCAIFTSSQLKALAGVALGRGEAGLSSCTYTSDPNGPTAQVGIFIGDGAKKTFDIDRELKHSFETLTGVGDEAYLEDGTVFVRVGTTWGEVNLVRMNDAAENRQPLRVAGAVLARHLS